MTKLPSSLTRVTLFSKLLAVILFFAFIILAFLAGMKYQTINPTPDTKKDQEKKLYICPDQEFVDCMPKVSLDGKLPEQPQCEKEFLAWAKVNCPNFKGAAY